MSAVMSNLPKAVRKQIANAQKVADEYYKQIADGQPDPNAPPSGDPPAGDPPAGDPPVDPPAPPATPPEAAKPATPTPIPQDTWETKYKVLQGKYNAEVPRLQNQVRELIDTTRNLRDQVTATQNLLASLNAPQNTPPANPPAPAAAKRLVTDEEIKQFGPDLFDFIKRAAAESVVPVVDSKIESRVAPVVSKVEQTASNVATTQKREELRLRDQVLALLDDKVPTWRELNEDSAFLEWLDQVDPYSGYQRGALLEAAFAKYDGPRVVHFFRGYLNEHAALNPNPAPPAAGTPPAPKPQKELKDFVAPGAPKPGAAVAPDGSGKRVWYRAEIAKFYKECQDGKYKARPEERKRLEADIFAAQSEGRIR